MSDAETQRTTPHEIEAIDEFHGLVHAPILMLRPALVGALEVFPELRLDDLFGVGVITAARSYLTYVAPPGVQLQASRWMYETGIAGVAGNVPELCTELGFDPVLLARRVFFLLEVWKEFDANSISLEELEAKVERLNAMARRVHEQCLRALHKYGAWLTEAGHPSQWPKTRPHLHELSSYLDEKLPLPLETAGSEAVLRRLNRAKQVDDVESVADLVGDYLSRCGEARERPRSLPVYIGNDRKLRADVGGMLDGMRSAAYRAFSTRGYRNIDDIAPEVLGEAPSAEQLVVEAEARDDQARAVQLLEVAALDEIDRQILEMLKEGGWSRAARARKVQMTPAAVRKREQKIVGRAFAAADSEALRSILRRQSRAG